MAEIFSFSNAKWAKLHRERVIASGKPYCGVCYDEDRAVNELVPCKQYDGEDNLYCAHCGTEFPV